MRRNQNKLVRRRSGAGMTEYIIIVGLVALGLFAAVQRFGLQIDATIRGTAGAFTRGTNSGANGGYGEVPAGATSSKHPPGKIGPDGHCNFPGGCSQTHT